MILEDLMTERLEAYRRAAIADLWLRAAGRPETEVARWAKPATFAELAKSEWSPEFAQLMRNRLIMGALRYGRLNAPCKRRYDRVVAVRHRLNEYAATGNGARRLRALPCVAELTGVTCVRCRRCLDRPLDAVTAFVIHGTRATQAARALAGASGAQGRLKGVG